MWTYLSDHLSEEDATGTLQRIQVKHAPPPQANRLASFGAPRPANGGSADPVQHALIGDPRHLHAQPYGRAVDEQGEADCETGQRGYPERLRRGLPGRPEDRRRPAHARQPGPDVHGPPARARGPDVHRRAGGIAPPVVGPNARVVP